MAKLTINEIALHCETRRDWEEQFGIGCPGYIPYWVAYMPEDQRVQYLLLSKHEYIDFSAEMLHKGFNWHEWEPFHWQ